METRQVPIFVINAFTSKWLSGNPAAVCLVKKNEEPTDEIKQNLATEMNLSETAFVTTRNLEDEFHTASNFGLRWFTPTTEVSLCGHATLASSEVLFNCIGNRNSSITFETMSGTLTVQKADDGKLTMDFPNQKPKRLTEALKELQDLVKVAVGPLPYQDVQYSPPTQKLLIRLQDDVHRSQFESYTPTADSLLRAHSGNQVKGVIVTLKGSAANECTSDTGEVYDFVSRFYAPWSGVHEDPVTGSAHSVLGPYWAEVLNKKHLFGCQCSKRTGQLWLDVYSDERIKITGKASVFISGTANISL